MRGVIAAICWRLVGLRTANTGTGVAQAQSRVAQNVVVALDHGWQFRQIAPGAQESENGWLPATVPGDVHLDLLANKKIPDPFVRDNEAKLQWIEKESFEYRLNFDATAAMLARSNVDLVFDGLDAASQVYVNGIQVLSADNSFRVWRVAVKRHLHAGKEPAARGVSFADQGCGSCRRERPFPVAIEDRGQDLCSQGRL